MTDRPPPIITKEQLESLSKEELVILLVQALEAQQMATSNMKTMNDLLAKADVRIRELDSQNKSMEAELLVLRNRPQ